MPELEKPPLGITPKNIWIYKRKQEIREAIARYIEAGWDIPSEWLRELGELTDKEWTRADQLQEDYQREAAGDFQP